MEGNLVSGLVSVMGRPRGQFVAQRIAGDQLDRFGFPALVDAFCTHMAVEGFADETVRVARSHLGKLATWLAGQGVTHPADVTNARVCCTDR